MLELFSELLLETSCGFSVPMLFGGSVAYIHTSNAYNVLGITDEDNFWEEKLWQWCKGKSKNNTKNNNK